MPPPLSEEPGLGASGTDGAGAVGVDVVGVVGVTGVVGVVVVGVGGALGEGASEPPHAVSMAVARNTDSQRAFMDLFRLFVCIVHGCGRTFNCVGFKVAVDACAVSVGPFLVGCPYSLG